MNVFLYRVDSSFGQILTLLLRNEILVSHFKYRRISVAFENERSPRFTLIENMAVLRLYLLFLHPSVYEAKSYIPLSFKTIKFGMCSVEKTFVYNFKKREHQFATLFLRKLAIYSFPFLHIFSKQILLTMALYQSTIVGK